MNRYTYKSSTRSPQLITWKFVIYAFSIVLVFNAIAEALAFKQNQSELNPNAAGIQSKITNPLNLLEGKKVAVSHWSQFGNSKQRENEISATLSVYSSTRWRMDLNFKSSEATVVFCRSGMLTFSTQTKNDGQHYYTDVGFDKGVQSEIQNRMIGYSTLDGTSRIMLSPLAEFLSMPGLNFESIMPTSSHSGRKAEKVIWNFPADGDTPSRSGELIWFPDDGYLIESMRFQFNPQSTDDGQEPTVYSSKVEFDLTPEGSVMPVKLVKSSPGMTEYYELKIIGSAETDSGFYTPEALGLVSPYNPYWGVWFWWSAGILFCLLGGSVLVWKLRKT